MDLKLTGKRALVTGSSSGIGAEIARMLAGEGATVLVHGRNQERVDAVVAQIRAAGGHAEAILADFNSSEEIATVIHVVERVSNCIDILVINVGGSARRAHPTWLH